MQFHANIAAPVPDFPGYFATRSGQILSTVRGGIRQLKQHAHPKGYLMVSPGNGRRPVRRWVHRLVLEAFDRSRLPHEVCMHLNAKRDDNKVENLRWGTAKENSAQMVADGNGPKSKRISDAMRKEIISSKETNSWWAEKIGCDRSYISHIRSGRRLSGQRRV